MREDRRWEMGEREEMGDTGDDELYFCGVSSNLEAHGN